MTDATIGVRLWLIKMSLQCNKKGKKINLKTQKMTVKRLKTYKGFEHYSEEDASHVITELEKYARIIFHHITEK